jgi:hypothetical protein
MTRRLLFLSVFALTACASSTYRPPVVTPPTPTTYTLVIHVCDGTPCEPGNEQQKVPEAQVEIEAQGTVYVEHADGAGNLAVRDLVAGTRSVCAGGSSSGYKRACLAVPLPRPAGQDVFLLLERDVPPILPLTADGRIFRAGGEAWRYKGVSAFQLLDRFARGEDIQPFLDAYRGFNVLRVWPYVPRADWGAKAWDSPAPDAVVRFLAAVGRLGWRVELTLLTDDDPARIPQAKQLVAALGAARPPNLLLEIGNEPRVHKSIDTRALKADLDASGFLYASGDAAAEAFGSYGTLHTARDPEWVRRAHDLLEFFQGGGPDAPTDPPHRFPAIADEPIRPDQAGYNAADFRAYAAACALLGAGLTFHSETGKYALPPTPEEARIAAVVLEALDALPPDASLGSYRRIDEGGRSLRTYVVGERYMVRIRPTTTAAPEPGWTALDAEGVLWRR